MLQLISINSKKKTQNGIVLYSSLDKTSGVIYNLNRSSLNSIILKIHLNLYCNIEHNLYTLNNNKIERLITTFPAETTINNIFKITLKEKETKIAIFTKNKYNETSIIPTIILKSLKVCDTNTISKELNYFPEASLQVNNNIYDYLDAIYYINMKERPNRKIHIIRQLMKLEIPKQLVIPIDAVALPNNPQIGCALSHMKALSHATKNDYDTILILEDDFTFNIDHNTLLTRLSELNNLDEDWDICMLSTVNSKTTNTYSKYINRVSKADTTAAYLIRKKAFSLIFNIFYQCSKPKPEFRANQSAIDVAWQVLQPKLNWFIFKPQLGYQSEKFTSDIESYRHIQYKI